MIDWLPYAGIPLVILACGVVIGRALVEMAASRCAVAGHGAGLSLTWIDSVCIGAIAVVIFLAMAGVAIAWIPWDHREISGQVTLGALVLACGSIGWRMGRRRLMRGSTSAEHAFVVAYLVLSVIALALATMSVRLPSHLPDGPYVAKRDVLGVRIQYLTGNLPADNSLPHVVTEYLLRDISFTQERPIMPGQEVTNRPILAAVVTLPWRAAVSMPPGWQGEMPRLAYVGTTWPDYSALMEDRAAYLCSLAVGVALNALLLLGVGAIVARWASVPRGVLAACTLLLMLTAPYFLFQTLFTWPKSMAAFFVVIAYLAATQWRVSWLAGVSLGLAYLSHPYAMVFVGAHMAWLAFRAFRVLARLWRASGPAARAGLVRLAYRGACIAGAAAMVVAPWIWWSRFHLAIPTDLVQQNFWIPGQLPKDFAWVRVVNLLNTLLPVHLLGYPFDVMRLVRGSQVTLPGAIGLVAALAALHQICQRSTNFTASTLVLWIMPAMALVFVFSIATVPALHGLQGPFALLCVVAVGHLLNLLPAWAVVTVVVLQSAANLLVLGRYLGHLL